MNFLMLSRVSVRRTAVVCNEIKSIKSNLQR